ncbi:MAG TPA: cupin domain-containing protein [Methylomirabilota bacterium]|jgi:quercetin dioxygenase-like cupin family protein|nr:cupin domain-containing protein [Methylomirabilota bacterium]
MTTGAEPPAPRSGELRARPTVQVDNPHVRVTEWAFAAGAATGWHRHEHAYVVVPMTTGTLRLRSGDGEHTAELVRGQAYYRPAGAEHDVVNANAHPFVFVEIEVKIPAPDARPRGGGAR